MKVLLEAAHPAHVHFLIPIGDALRARGDDVALAVRDKDVTRDLAEATDIDVLLPPRSGTAWKRLPSGRVRQIAELAVRVRWLRKVVRRGRFDLVVTRNPSGVIAGWLARVPTIFDTDDGRAAGIHFSLARPFASVITTPELLTEDLGPRQRRYPGLKASVFLHPNRFRRDATVRQRYGIEDGDSLVVARFSANTASHDAGVRSVEPAVIEDIVRRCSELAHVLVSVEGRQSVIVPSRQSSTLSSSVPVQPRDFLHLLAGADLHVGDSGSVTIEAAVLGVPTVRIADTRRSIITELSAIGLVHDFSLAQLEEFTHELDVALRLLPQVRETLDPTVAGLSPRFEDVLPWFVDVCDSVHASRKKSS